MNVLGFLVDKQDVKCAALLTQICTSPKDDCVRFFWHMVCNAWRLQILHKWNFLRQADHYKPLKLIIVVKKVKKISLLTLFWHQHWANLLTKNWIGVFVFESFCQKFLTTNVFCQKVFDKKKYFAKKFLTKNTIFPKSFRQKRVFCQKVWDRSGAGWLHLADLWHWP